MSKEQKPYAVYCLGADSKTVFIRNVLAAMNFEFRGPITSVGLSGLEYTFDAMGVREKEKHTVLVIGSFEPSLYSLNSQATIAKYGGMSVDPVEKDALLTAYDVSEYLRLNGWEVDILLLNNALDLIQSGIDMFDYEAIKPLVEEGTAHWGTGDEGYMGIPSEKIKRLAAAVGGCFLSLNDMTLDEVRQLSNVNEDSPIDQTREILRKHRILQFFEPPTDELILTAAHRLRDKGGVNATELIKRSVELKHPPFENAILTGVPFSDTLAIIDELQKRKLIVRVKTGLFETLPNGMQAVSEIEATSQENWVIRVIKALRGGAIFDVPIK